MSTLEKILYTLKLRGISDSELARQIGLSRSTVTDWKNGKTSSYKKHIGKIAEVLQISPEWLLDDELGCEHLNTNYFNEMINSLSIELNTSVDTLMDIYKNKPIPDGYKNNLSKKNLKDIFEYYLFEKNHDSMLLTSMLDELLDVSNTLTEDEISQVIQYINFLKSQRAKDEENNK